MKQDMLETIIPKSDGDSIMVVLGEQRGQVSRGSSAQVCFLSPLCLFTASLRLCGSRWAVSFRGTRTSAERWFSWTGMRRKCSRWTTTPFVTTWELLITDHRDLSYCLFVISGQYFNSMQLCNKTLEKLHCSVNDITRSSVSQFTFISK